MGLKQSVVIVNEYSIKNKSGKGGSRGGTPGDYVMRYMSRPRATEDLTPVRLQDTDQFIMRYMARKDASETCISIEDEKQKMREAQGFGGVAFGYGDVSLSDEKLRWASKDIQRKFESGKTVMKTVLSFDEDYLRENGIIDPTFEFKKEGDYRGNIDQMKLRMAIMNGMEKMGRDYDDLRYVGVIQVDTAHVHCHLAMVDGGRGNIMPDGTQRGKLSEKNKRDLRRGIDTFLDEKQKVAMMSSNVYHDKRNALCYIKKFTFKTMEEHGTPQLLMACLPDDKNLWRASTNRKEMRKANAIVREYVQAVLDEPNSGFTEARRSISQYVRERADRENLTIQEQRHLQHTGEERIIEDCMNGVYSVLKQIPDEERTTRTPMLDAMSMDFEAMSKKTDDPMVEFGFRLRAYSSRLEHHKKEMNKYHDYVRQYEDTEQKSADSRVLYDFFKEEEEYNNKLVSKYRHFLAFIPPKDKYEEQFNELMEYRRKIHNRKRMKDDPSFKRMSPENAEDYGKKVYEQNGGRFVATNPLLIEQQIQQMQAHYDRDEEDFRMKLSEYGLVMDDKGIKKGDFYDFEDVKALDLHHLAYDWNYDVPITKGNLENFVDAANERWDKYQKACDYLRQTGQDLMIEREFDNRDIRAMKQLADSLQVKPVIPKDDTVISYKRDSRTVSLDADYTKDMQRAVRLTVKSISESPEMIERDDRARGE